MEAAPAPIYGGLSLWAKPYRQDNDGLRYVGRVVPEFGGGVWDSRGNTGWHTCPHGDVFIDGSGLCYGVVYQLPARNGRARFVAGFEFGGVDGGPSLDLATVYESEFEDNAQDGARHSGAARAADNAARKAGEEEREYQTAWRAGSDYAEKAEEIETARQAALALLAERRAARKAGGVELPAICAAIRETVTRARETITQAREDMAELVAGDYADLIFWPGDDRLQGAFCEGAGLESFPA
jgi:hypothetical protein